MADREKVIYALERCICHVPDACRDCAYDAGHPYNECVEMLMKDALELLKSDGWISVNDRLPDKAGTYIICDHYGNVMSRHFCKSHGRFSGYWHFNGSAKYGNPRYWKLMPEAPEMEGT
jgi:hypothetical protein